MLTAREKEIMELMAEGLTNKEIAERFNIGYTTVVTHIQAIYDKFNVSTNDRMTKGVIRVRAVIHYLKNKEDILKNQK